MQLKAPTDKVEEKPDNLDSINRKMRNIGDPTPYDGKDKSKGRAGRIPNFVINAIVKVFRRRGHKCTNKNEPRYNGKRFRGCPVPRYRRFGEDRKRAPYFCVYCPLVKDPDPPEDY